MPSGQLPAHRNA